MMNLKPNIYSPWWYNHLLIFVVIILI